MELAGKKIFFGLGGEELGLPLKRSDSQRHDTQEQQAQCVLTPDEARVEVSQSRADVDVDVSRKQTNKKQNKVNDRKYQPKVLSRLEQSKKTAQKKKKDTGDVWTHGLTSSTKQAPYTSTPILYHPHRTGPRWCRRPAGRSCPSHKD
jgi:hypothetical protein